MTIKKTFLLVTLFSAGASIAVCQQAGSPSLASDQIKQGNACYENKEYPQAVSLYTKAVTAYPKSELAALAHYKCAKAFKAMGKYNEAISECSGAIAIDPLMNGAIAYLLRGFLYEKTGKYKDAISDYSKVLLIDPKNKAAGLCRKRILLRGYAAFTKAGLAAFDSGVNAYNNRDGLSAKKELGKALVLFANASRLDTGGKTAPGMTNFAKGLIYQISARENLDATKPADSRYAKAAQMRRAYHPLAAANAYYERAGQYLKDKKLTSLLKDYKTVNDRDLIMARGRFPNLEYGSSKYMRAVETEANCIVNFDIAGESLAAGNHNEAKRVLSKNESMASDLKRLKSPNADGIGRLARAYSRLDTILSYPLRDTAWMKANRATIEKEISACVDELGAAKSGLVDVALLNTCSKLLKNLSAIQAMVEKAGT